MKKYTYSVFYILISFLLFQAIAKAQNPILPVGTYIADPTARVWKDGKLYVYGSRDESEKYYCSFDHYVLSTSDLINWEVTKDVFASKGKNDKVAYNDALLFAPDCIYKNGTYYLYYCQPYGPSPEGVTMSKTPEGPFGEGKAIDLKGHNQIDPGIFIDDDGTVIYLWGQFNLKMAKMNADMSSFDEKTLKTNVINEKKHFFHEGAFLTKRKGIYYLIYADISRAGRPTCLGYATSKSPFGPYKYGGVIVDNDFSDPEVWNNHGSIVEFKNQWYVFYHRSTHSSTQMRRTCIEPISFNKDGSINEVEMTSQGAAGPLSAFKDIEVERACILYGKAYFKLFGENNEKLTSIKHSDKAAYKYIDFGNGQAKKVEIVVAPGENPGKISINIGKTWHQKIATVNIPAKKENEEWITVSADIQNVSGVHELWMTFEGKGDDIYSIDKFKFIK